MEPSRRTVLQLYRTLLREGSKFQNYNFRDYTLRRIRHSFQQHKSETDVNKIQSFVKSAEENLQLIKRQVTVGSLYIDPPLVVEKQ